VTLRSLTTAVALLLLAAGPVRAQDADSASEESACEAGELSLASAETPSTDGATNGAEDAYRVPLANDRPATVVTPQTDAEAAVQETLEKDGVHVVHFWAPWCPNAKNELESGWASVIEDNPEVSFTFVNIWNDGEAGSSVLDRYDIPADRITALQQPDLGPSDTEANRRKAFLGIPVTWTPSTWIFHNQGELAFAMNYGEMKMETIQTLIDATQQDW
jgi:thiol-disulfide isomerase/thioredoxin